MITLPVVTLESSRKVPDLVCQHVLLHVTSCREATLTHVTLVGAFFGMAAIMNVQSTLTGKRFEANITCSVMFAT